MNEGFKKFKKKIFLEALIKSIVIGISIGIILFTVPYLYILIKEIDFSILYLLLMALVGMIISFGLSYLILKQNDKKIAKRLDKELNLNEKVQTMVEYMNEDSPIVNIQRENTQEILNQTSLKKLTTKISAFLIVLVVISLSLGVTTLAYPKPEVNPLPEKEWSSDDWTKNAIYNLIRTVNKTEFNEELKAKYIQKLEEFVDSLDNIKTETRLVLAVSELVAYNELEVDIVNSNNEIYEVLITSNNSRITDIAGQIYLLNPEKLEIALEAIIITINNQASVIEVFDRELRTLLDKPELDKEDPLHQSLYQLSKDLMTCTTAENVNDAVKMVIDKSTKPILEIIKTQKANQDITDYIFEELVEILGLEEYFKNLISDNEQNGSSQGDGPKPELPTKGTGGYDTGEFIVASDDVCFDLEKGIVKYGEIIDMYNGIIAGLYKDGKLPKEYEEFFKQYYGILYTPKTDEENK